MLYKSCLLVIGSQYSENQWPCLVIACHVFVIYICNKDYILQVKANREKREKEIEKKHKAQQAKKDAEFKARQMIKKEEMMKAAKKKQEEEEMQKEMARIRREMAEERKRHEEEKQRYIDQRAMK